MQDRMTTTITDQLNYKNTSTFMGSRISVLISFLKYIPSAPFFGVGFWNRSSYSNIMKYGSHNFFIQMLLETGIAGFSLFILLLIQLWKDSKHCFKHLKNSKGSVLGFQAAFISILTSCLTEEYLYGGIVLLTLSIYYGLMLAESKFNNKSYP